MAAPHRLSRFILRFNNASVTRNWLLLSTSNITAQFLGMLAAIRIARLLRPAGYGQLSIVQTAATIAVVIGGLGLRQVIIRECARYPELSGTIFRKAFTLQLVAAIPVGCGILLYFRFGVESIPSDLVPLTIGLFGGLLFWELIESVAFGHEKVYYSAIMMLAGNLLWVLFAWFCPTRFVTPATACTAIVLIQLAKCIAYFGVAARNNLIHDTTRRVLAIDMAKSSLPFYWMTLLAMVANSLPVIFLATRTTPHEVGIYSAGLKLTGPVHIIIMALTASLLPSLSRLAIENRSRFVATIQKFMIEGTLIGIGLSLTISVFRTEIVMILFGPGYRTSQEVIFFLIWFTVFWLILNLIATCLASANRHGLMVRLATAHAIITAPTLLLCANFGAVILASALCAMSVISAIYHWYFFNKDLECNLPLRIPVILFASSFALMALSWMISHYAPLMLRIAFFFLFSTVFIYLGLRYLSKQNVETT